MCAAAAARAASFGGGNAAAASSARVSSASSSGSTRTPASGGTNSGGPPTSVATTVLPDAIASRIDCPNGSISEGAQTTSAAARYPGSSSVETRPTTRTRSRPSSRLRSGPSPTNVRLPRPSFANASASLTTFFRSLNVPDREVRRPLGVTGPRPSAGRA